MIIKLFVEVRFAERGGMGRRIKKLERCGGEMRV